METVLHTVCSIKRGGSRKKLFKGTRARREGNDLAEQQQGRISLREARRKRVINFSRSSRREARRSSPFRN